MWTRAPGGAAWMQKDAWIPSGFFLIAGVLDVELFRKGTLDVELFRKGTWLYVVLA